MKSKLVWFVLTVMLFGVGSCDKGSTPSANFDRRPMLENWGNNLIVPWYEALNQHAADMQEAAGTFVTSPDVGTLSTLREEWLLAYKAYQRCAYFNFGPADNQLFNAAVNTFPTGKNKVETNISSGTYNLSQVSNNDAKGFSALDYLLYGLAADDEALLEFYLTDSNAENRKQYVLDLVNDIAERAADVYQAWSPSGDNYLATFVSATGNDVGSSLGMLVNAMVQYYEADVRDDKIGIPLGIRSLNVPIPNNCEALYAQKSIELATESVTALQHIYLGKNDTDGIGLDDNLSAINARYNGGSLDEIIQIQLGLAIANVSTIPEPYSETVVDNQTPATLAYQELQKLVVLLKADMTSSLGILITYQDNDGD